MHLPPNVQLQVFYFQTHLDLISLPPRYSDLQMTCQGQKRAQLSLALGWSCGRRGSGPAVLLSGGLAGGRGEGSLAGCAVAMEVMVAGLGAHSCLEGATPRSAGGERGDGAAPRCLCQLLVVSSEPSRATAPGCTLPDASAGGPGVTAEARPLSLDVLATIGAGTQTSGRAGAPGTATGPPSWASDERQSWASICSPLAGTGAGTGFAKLPARGEGVAILHGGL